MLSPVWAQNRILKNIVARLGLQGEPGQCALVDQKEFLQLQALASNHPWISASQREVAHRMTGDVRSIYLGSGMDYEESRPYQLGDDIRFMNWRLTARTGESYMKVFREEKKPATFILVDRRSAMRFGSKRRLKVTQAVRIAAYIAFSAKQRHCGVAGVVLNNKPEWFDAHNDYAGIFHFLNQAALPCPPAYTEKQTEPSIDHVIKLLQKMLVAGSDVCLVSDFADLTEASRVALLQLSIECNLTAVHIYDAAEISLPRAGKLHVQNTLSTGDAMTDTDNTAIVEAYQKKADRHMHACEQLFSSLGISYIRLRADSEHIDKDVMRRS